jgi:probable HAF family extracellular repeat protein
MKRFFSLLTVLLAATAGSAFAQFTFTSLDFPRGTKTTARSINNRGTIVGSYRIDPPRHALVIKHGHYVPLAPSGLLGANFSEAFKINDHGDVVGDYDDGVTHGFLLSKGVLTTLDFPGADATIAFGVNQSGVVVGEWDVLDAQGNLLAYHGFIWKDGAFTDVNFPGSPDTSILGINDEGDYVGVWDSDVNAPSGHAFVKTEERCTSFDFPDAVLTEANDINEDGQIVGLYSDAGGSTHGFLKVRASFTTIDYPSAAYTSAWGINSAGQIVGTHLDTPDGPDRGFLARRREARN